MKHLSALDALFLHLETPETPMHVGMIRLGREICKAGRPKCEDCPLFELCPTGPVVLGVARRPSSTS